MQAGWRDQLELSRCQWNASVWLCQIPWVWFAYSWVWLCHHWGSSTEFTNRASLPVHHIIGCGCTGGVVQEGVRSSAYWALFAQLIGQARCETPSATLLDTVLPSALAQHGMDMPIPTRTLSPAFVTPMGDTASHPGHLIPMTADTLRHARDLRYGGGGHAEWIARACGRISEPPWRARHAGSHDPHIRSMEG